MNGEMRVKGKVVQYRELVRKNDKRMRVRGVNGDSSVLQRGVEGVGWHVERQVGGVDGGE